MCLAVPGKLISIDRQTTPLTGIVDFDGVSKKVCLEFVPDARPGEYVIVHVGFALTLLDEAEASKTLDLIREMNEQAIRPPGGAA